MPTPNELTAITRPRRMLPDIRDFDEFFRMPMGSLFREMMAPGEGAGLQRAFPSIDLSETDDQYHIEAEVPGCKPEDVRVTLEGDRLTISGEKKAEQKKEEGQRHIYERSYGAFQRSFTLPQPVDPDSVDAEMSGGILNIRLKKTEKTKAKQVKVKAGKG